ncbi:MAG TPA: helix-hairpin-helix domain-containing protein [Candidatus Edwardsbacteria bacterium]|nr:helix-hairpin-helix domain-containing protein [Candidatus Edwardsbacteria bacterium]
MIGLTPDEKKVIIFFLAVNAVGLGLLAYKRAHPSQLPGLRETAAGLPAAADSMAAAPPTAPAEFGRPKKELLTGRIDINRADEGLLQRLPGIGPAMAKRIVDYRRSEGGFKSVRELGEVKGIGRKKLKLLLEHVSVGP